MIGSAAPLAQIGQSCPSDHLLHLEQEVASLRKQARHKDQLWQAAEAEATLATQELVKYRLTIGVQLDHLGGNLEQYKRMLQQAVETT